MSNMLSRKEMRSLNRALAKRTGGRIVFPWSIDPVNPVKRFNCFQQETVLVFAVFLVEEPG